MIASSPRAKPSRVTAAPPEIVYTAARLDDDVHVLIVDHPDELHVVFDDRLDATQLAAALTDAVRDNMAKQRWNRTITALLDSADDD